MTVQRQFERFCFIPVSVGLCIILGAGCSQLDPDRTMIDKITKPLPAIDEQPTNGMSSSGTVSLGKLRRQLAEWHRPSRPDTSYHVGCDDSVEISIRSLENPGQDAVVKQTVDQTGGITLPYVGRVDVKGLTARELTTRLVDLYKGKYLQNPTISVLVSDYKSLQVMVLGAVKDQGRHYLKQDETTLIDLLHEVGGVTSERGSLLIVTPDSAPNNGPAIPDNSAGSSDDVNSALATMTNRIEIDIGQLYNSGNPEWNMVIRNGDSVTIPPARNNFIYVLGYIRGPGVYRIEPDTPMTVWQAYNKAGGPTAQGRAENCRLVRMLPEGKRTMYAVDLTQIIGGTKDDVVMHPGDSLLVGASWLTKWGEILKVGASATPSYSPAP